MDYCTTLDEGIQDAGKPRMGEMKAQLSRWMKDKSDGSKKEVEQTYGSEIGGLLSSTDVRTLVAIVTIE